MKTDNRIITSPFDEEQFINGVIEVNSIEDLVIANANLITAMHIDLCIPDSPEMCEIKDNFIEKQKIKVNAFLESIGSINRSLLMDNITYLLKEKQLRMSDLEYILDISSGYISRTMKADSDKRLSSEHLWKISRLFNIDLETLVSIDLSKTYTQEDRLMALVTKLKYETMKKIIEWEFFTQCGQTIPFLFEGNPEITEAVNSRFHCTQTILGDSYRPIYAKEGNLYMIAYEGFICKNPGSPIDGLTIIPYSKASKKEPNIKKCHFDIFKINYQSGSHEIHELFTSAVFSEKFQNAVCDLYCEIEKSADRIFKMKPELLNLLNNYI